MYNTNCLKFGLYSVSVAYSLPSRGTQIYQGRKGGIQGSLCYKKIALSLVQQRIRSLPARMLDLREEILTLHQFPNVERSLYMVSIWEQHYG